MAMTTLLSAETANQGLVAFSAIGEGRSGDFEKVYAAHSQPVYYLALRFLGDPVHAQDAAHDVFVKAFRSFGDFRGDSEVRTWLYRITLHHCTNLRQRWSSRNIHLAEDASVLEGEPSAVRDPLKALETKELGQRIQNALDQLPDEYRCLLLLVADQDLSYEQVGQITQQTTDAVRGKLHRARKAFSAVFAKTA
jgi:RNA polymerase sigma-70 factor (ECF subfamily)